MGAETESAATRRIIVEGVKELHGTEHDIIPDRIEAGTFLVAGAIWGNGITVKRGEPKHVEAVTKALSNCGFKIESSENSITVSPNGVATPLELATRTYPGFATDSLSQNRA